MAAERLSAGVSASTSPSAAGIMAAAAAPCTARAATSAPTLGASALASEATVNSATPPMNTRRRPTRSATRPAGVSSAANSTAYAVITQDSSVTEVPRKSVARSGNARFTTVTSRKARKVAPDAISRTGMPAPSDPLEDRARAGAPGRAHRDQAQLRVRALELVHERGDQPRAGGAQRMAERQRAPVHVHPVHVGLHLA